MEDKIRGRLSNQTETLHGKLTNQTLQIRGQISNKGGVITDHRLLEHRDALDQHPIEAVTNLEPELSQRPSMAITNTEIQDILNL